MVFFIPPINSTRSSFRQRRVLKDRYMDERREEGSDGGREGEVEEGRRREGKGTSIAPAEERKARRSVSVAHNTAEHGAPPHHGDGDGREHGAAADVEGRERPADHVAKRVPLPLVVERLWRRRARA